MSQNVKGILIVCCAVLIIVFIIIFFNDRDHDNNSSAIDFTFTTSVKIALLNGCGYRGIATDVKDYFVEKSFAMIDVISWKNVPGGNYIYDKTVIVVKKENQEKLEYLMKVTGISRRIYALNSDTMEEFQIILGKDYLEFFKE